MGEFTDTTPWAKQVTLGTSQSFTCPARQPSYGVSFTWIGKDQIKFKRNERRAIAPNGNLFIMYVTRDDVNEINGLGGIRCTMSAANTYYSSGALTLTTPSGNVQNKTVNDNLILVDDNKKFSMTKHLVRESSYH